MYSERRRVWNARSSMGKVARGAGSRNIGAPTGFGDVGATGGVRRCRCDTLNLDVYADCCK